MYKPLLALAALFFAVLPVPGQGDLHRSYDALRQAVEQKDAALVKKLAGETDALARQAAAAPAPADPADKKAWAAAVAFAKDVSTYSEYALYSIAMQAAAEARIEFLELLEKQNPKSKYLDQAYTYYFLALNETGQSARIPAIAQKAIANLPQNEDALQVLMEQAVAQKQTARAAAFGERLIASMKSHARPEEYPAADWEKKRNQFLSRAYLICGAAHAERNEHYQTDQDLRPAIPLLQNDKASLAVALFHLGVANYWLGKQTLNSARVLEAAKFSQQAAAIPGPFQQQAWTNAHLMKTEGEAMARGKR